MTYYTPKTLFFQYEYTKFVEIPNLNIKITTVRLLSLRNIAAVIKEGNDFIPKLIDKFPKARYNIAVNNVPEVYLMADFMLVKDAAKLWNLSQRRVSDLCKKGQIEGAIKRGYL